METIEIYKCCRCGKEMQTFARKFNIRRYSWRRFRMGKEEQKDLCNDCYNELNHWLKGTSDEVVHLKQRIEELEADLGIEHQRNETLVRYNEELVNEKQKLQKEFDNCKSFCPRECSLWKDFAKKYNDELLKDAIKNAIC